MNEGQLVIRLGVDYNKIQRFTGFVAIDMHGSINIFGRHLFMFFPIVKPIKRHVVRP
jgi:hypothetical protein